MNRDQDTSQHYRYFVALLLPTAIRDQVTAIKTDICQRSGSCAALKLLPHITLQPPFLYPAGQERSLTRVLSDCALRMPDLNIRLCGFGAFASRVIYVNVVPNPELLIYQEQLSQDLQQSLGIKGDHRPYRPHMTVAYRDLAKTAFYRAWPDFQDQPLVFEFKARAVTLLRHEGQRWQVAANYPRF